VPKQPDADVRESVIEKHLVTRLKAMRTTFPYRLVVVKKIGGPGWRGWPDRVALFDTNSFGFPGCTHWLEVKRPRGGRFEPLQLRCHANLRKMGFVVRVVNTRELVDAYIDDVVKVGPHNMPPTPMVTTLR